MGTLFFEEMRERHCLPDTYAEAARESSAMAAREVRRWIDDVRSRGGLGAATSMSRLERAMVASFQEALLKKFRAHFAFGDRMSGSGVSWEESGPLPIGSIAIDDITGGPWTQLLMWAEAQVFGGSQALLSKGGDPSMSFHELQAVDADATLAVLEGRAALGLIEHNNEIVGQVPVAETDRILSAFRARSELASRGFVLGAYAYPEDVAAAKMQALGVVLEPQAAPTALMDRALADTTRLVRKDFVSPLIEVGLAKGPELLDRIYLPLRIKYGGRWNYRMQTVVGGPDSLQLQEAVANQNHPQPTYFPFIMLSVPITDGEPAGGWLISERLYVTDPMRAYTLRTDQVSRMLTG